MAIAYVNGAVNFIDAADTSIASPAANHVSGNLLVVIISSRVGGATNVSSIADTAGNTYTRVNGTSTSYVGGIELWYAKNITGNANNVVTATLGASYTKRGIHVLQYSGCDAIAPLDQSAVGGSYSNAPATANIVTTSADEVLAAGYTTYVVTTTTPGAEYTKRTILGGADPSFGCSEDRIVTSTGTYNASVTPNVSTAWCMVLASFKEGEAPPPPPPPPPPEVTKAEAIKVTPRIETSPILPLIRDVLRKDYGRDGWDKFNL